MPKKEQIGTLTKMTVGEKNINKINKTILLVGETGTGKSTLVNALVNYAMGVEFEDNVWFKIVDEKDKTTQIESQTSDVTVYEIFGFEDAILPYSLTIIDTPGYGDTRGKGKDSIVSQRLFDLFRSEDGIHEINAVGLVMKASDNRLSDRLRYIFDSVASLFGKDLEKNIVALITHSDGIIPDNVLGAIENINIKCAVSDKNQPVHFVLNNCQSKQRRLETECGLENAWSVTMKGMSEFTNFVERCGPQKLKTTIKVLKTRIRLTACIQNLQDRIMMIEQKQREVREIRNIMRKHEEMNMAEDSTEEVEEVYKDRQDISSGMWFQVFYQGATCCTACEENCHYPGCTMAWSPKDCEVMKKKRCTSCTNKCPVSEHVKQNWIYVIKTRKVLKTKKEMKEKYEKNEAEYVTKLSFLEQLQNTMDQLTKQKDELLERSYDYVVRLEEIALNVNSLSTCIHLDFLSQKLREQGHEDKARTLEEMKSRMDEGTIAAMK